MVEKHHIRTNIQRSFVHGKTVPTFGECTATSTLSGINIFKSVKNNEGFNCDPNLNYIQYLYFKSPSKMKYCGGVSQIYRFEVLGLDLGMPVANII